MPRGGNRSLPAMSWPRPSRWRHRRACRCCRPVATLWTPHSNEIFASPAMAESMTKIAATQGEAFYRGELGEKMVAHSRSLGGAHALADFADHVADWVTPLTLDYRGYTVHEIPPNGQGIA